MSKFNFKRFIKSTSLFLKKHSPEILCIGGTIGVVGGTVLCCKASTTLGDKLDEHQLDVQNIKNHLEPDTKEYKDEMTRTYLHTAGAIAKSYAPGVLLEVAGIGCMHKGHAITKQRGIATATMLAGAQAAMSEYRERVANAIGEEAEDDLYHGYEKREYELTEDNGDGKKPKTCNVEVDEKSGKDLDNWSFIFDEQTSDAYEHDFEYNWDFLTCSQNVMNRQLEADGCIFVNDVLKQLGMRPIPSGQDYGWIYDPKVTDPIEIKIKRRRVPVDHAAFGEPTVQDLIMFSLNPQGNIHDLI